MHTIRSKFMPVGRILYIFVWIAAVPLLAFAQDKLNRDELQPLLVKLELLEKKGEEIRIQNESVNFQYKYLNKSNNRLVNDDVEAELNEQRASYQNTTDELSKKVEAISLLINSNDIDHEKKSRLIEQLNGLLKIQTAVLASYRKLSRQYAELIAGTQKQSHYMETYDVGKLTATEDIPIRPSSIKSINRKGSFTVKKTEGVIFIGAGGKSGPFYPTGNAICKMLNGAKKNQESELKCNSIHSAGSRVNLKLIKEGEYEFGIVRSDMLYRAYHAINPLWGIDFKLKNLRAVFDLFDQSFTVLARRDADINHVKDLVGKRVNIGGPGSAGRRAMEEVMNAMGWDIDTFKIATELRGIDVNRALCDNKLDAVVRVVTHPSALVHEAMLMCDAVIVEVSGAEIANIINKTPYYKESVIHKIYKNNKAKIKTFGLATTLVTSSKVEDKIVYDLVKSVFENFDKFVRAHPLLFNLKKSEMTQNEFVTPVHDAALLYYQQADLRD